MEWIRNWLLSVAGSILFGVICETLLPGGSIKKYVRVVAGLLLAAAMTAPLASLRGGKAPELDLPVSSAQAYAAHREMDGMQKRQVMQVYTAELEQKIGRFTAEQCGFPENAVQAEVCVSEEEARFGEIQCIAVTLSRPGNEGANLVEKLIPKLAQEFDVPESGIRVNTVKTREEA